MPLKSVQKLALATGGTLLISPWLANQGMIGNLVLSLAGVGTLATIPGTGSKEEDESLRAYFMGGVKRIWTDAQAEVREVVHEYGPPELSSAMDTAMGRGQDHKALFRKALEKSYIIVAETDGGKTWLEHQAMKVDIESGVRSLILDKSFGKRTTEEDVLTGMGFWWFAPVGEVVFKFGVENAHLLGDLLKTFYDERERRKALTEAAAERRQAAPVFQRWRLMIAEMNLTLGAYVKAHKRNNALPSPEDIDDWLEEILYDGHGYNILFGGDAQTAATGETGMNEAKRSQVNWFLMGSAAINPTELRKFGLPTGEWRPKVMAMRQVPGYERTGIVIISGQPHLFRPEAFDEIQLSFQRQANAVDQVEAWKQEIRDAVRDWVNAQETEPTHTQAFESFKGSMPTGFKTRGSDNPYWSALKSLVDEFKLVSA